MPARRRLALARNTRQRAPTNWARAVPANGTMTTVAATNKAILGSVVLSNPGIGETIRRTRGLVSIRSDQASAFEEITGAFGMMVVNDVALALGVTGIPGPVTEANDDGWFVWLPFSELMVGNAGASPASIFASRASMNYEFDSKAMRRVEEGFSVVMMIENEDSANGLVAGVSFSILSSRTA